MNKQCYPFLALDRACESGDAPLTALILENNNDDTGVHSVTGQSPLHAACSQGHVECVTLILKVSRSFICLYVACHMTLLNIKQQL